MKELHFRAKGLTAEDLQRWQKPAPPFVSPAKVLVGIIVVIAFIYTMSPFSDETPSPGDGALKIVEGPGESFFSGKGDGEILDSQPPVAGRNENKKVVHDFESNTEGWLIVCDGCDRAQKPDHISGGANGYISAKDPEKGKAIGLPTDVVVVFDLTESMIPCINPWRDEIARIINTLRKRRLDVRLGLVGFRDYDFDPETAVKHSKLTWNIESQFKEMWRWRPTQGGGTPEEDQYLGIMEALNMNWRDRNKEGLRVSKAIIVITDAPAKNPDHRGNTLASVLRAARSRKGLRIHSVITRPNKEVLEHARIIAQGTGGRWFSAETASRLADVLLKPTGVTKDDESPWMWQAPPEILRADTDLYGDKLMFDLRQSCAGRQFNAVDIILIGKNDYLFFDLPRNPGTDWTHYSVTLDESAGWMMN